MKSFDNVFEKIKNMIKFLFFLALALNSKLSFTQIINGVKSPSSFFGNQKILF